MKDWKKTLMRPDRPIIEAMRIIDESALQIALVVDEDMRLVGVITDGDIRRAVLRGMTLDLPVHQIMFKDFTTVGIHASRDEILDLMKEKDLKQIPVIDEQGCVIDLRVLVDLIRLSDRENWAVIMAGGVGSRLQPLTDDCPKPLLMVGNKPLLETIVENFAEFGIRKIFVSVNYKAEMIEAFLGNGSRWNIDIRYLREKERMGTVGALGLLPERPAHPFIVMNGDVLTKVNFQYLLDFHQVHRAKATMCVRDYHFQVPYGVVRTDQHRLTGIDEKPVQQFFVNAGIYVLEPEVLNIIPHDAYLDMPDLFGRLFKEGHETIVFPIHEYWMDIGKIDDLERARGEYAKNFTNGTK